MPKVTMIPATINPLTHLPKVAAQKRRVAGYARVSTDSDEQFTSYEAQVDYYTKFIQSKPEWDFVKVYTDEGISGCNTKKRDGFNSMVSDALAGKIDLIVTKSVSRFARNTVDSLVTIRKLKENGVECHFEKEGIFTFDGKGELLITIMSSLAQEESRSISENITWGQRKSFADGKVHLAYKRFLGYEKGEDGRPTIVESEAKIVQLIYRLFLDGKSQASICRYLEDLGNIRYYYSRISQKINRFHEFGYLKSDVGFFCFRVFEKGGCSKVLCGVFSFRDVRGKAVAVKFFVGFRRRM